MRLLVCLDFSPLSDRVVAEAIALARPSGASIVLLHVVRTEPALTTRGSGPPGGHRVPPAHVDEVGAKVAAVAERMRAEGLEVRPELRLADGEIHDAILEEIATHQASYVVIGSHGHSQVFELVIGSVTRGVLRGARVPVLVVADPELA